ncbi:MAG: cytochrome c3 family protein, partial [Thermoanaerobaculia bacterium]
DARANLELVEKGKGIHNVRYSLALLDAAHGQLNEARREQGLAEVGAPWPTAPYESECLSCHAGAEATSAGAFGQVFPHEPHVVGRGIECTECHSTHEEREATGVGALEIDASACNACHHAEATADTCVSCHGGVLKRVVASELGDFDHSMHVEDMGVACTGCHGTPPRLSRSPDLEVCADCH